MRIHNLSNEEVLRALVTFGEGLSEEEVRKRLSEFGYNELTPAKDRPLWKRFAAQFTHFLAILLWIAAALSFISEYLHPGEGMFILGNAIIAVICINALFTFIQEYRAERAVEELKKLLPFYVTVLRKSGERRVQSREIVPGDIILVSEGDRIPADARLIETSFLKVNNAPLTGEADPMLRDHLPYGGEYMDSKNIIFAGTTVLSGSGRAVVFSTGMSTEFGRIAHLSVAVEEGLSPLQKEIMKATRIVATIAAAVGVFFFSLGFFIGSTFWNNFIFAIGITVALIPEGMLPTVTLALALGSQRMAKKMALIKTLTSVETLGSVTVICTDKTGTLTQNRMAVRKLWFNGETREIQNGGQVDLSVLFTIASSCNNARLVGGEYRGDPTDAALLKAVHGALGVVLSNRITEIPFDSERKRMTTVNRIDGKLKVFSKGAPESLLPLCAYLLLNGETVAFQEDLKAHVVAAYRGMMDCGLRVLSFAYRELSEEDMSVTAGDIEKDFVLAGLIGLEDPPRPEVPEAVRRCREAGIKVIMTTGDGSLTALAVARETGLVTGRPLVIEGNEMEKLADSELREKLTHPEVLFARMTPKHKMRIVSVLKAEGEIVAVTGDGVNDAPALKKADIGIAMGIAGTDVAKEASDMVLLDDNFATIINAVEEGRSVYDNIKKFITYIFASNIPEAVPYLAYVLFSIPLPLSIIQILAVDLGTDMLPALALGAEKPIPGVMRQPPRRMNERLLNFSLISRAYLFLGPLEALACMFGFFWVLRQGGWIWGGELSLTDPLYQEATTACLTAIVLCQVGNVFACRSSRESLFKIGIFTNYLVFIGIGVELLLQLFIVYHPWGNWLFSTRPLSLEIWITLLPFAGMMLIAEEMRKLFVAKYLKFYAR